MLPAKYKPNSSSGSGEESFKCLFVLPDKYMTAILKF